MLLLNSLRQISLPQTPWSKAALASHYYPLLSLLTPAVLGSNCRGGEKIRASVAMVTRPGNEQILNMLILTDAFLQKYWKSVRQVHPYAQFFQAGSHLSSESYSYVPQLMLYNTSIFIPLWKVLSADQDLNKLNM